MGWRSGRSLRYMVLTQGFSKSLKLGESQGCSQWKACLRPCFHFQIGPRAWLTNGGWLLVGSFGSSSGLIECPQDMAVGFPRLRDSRSQGRGCSAFYNLALKVTRCRDFPGGPVAKTPPSQCRGSQFDSWSGS